MFICLFREKINDLFDVLVKIGENTKKVTAKYLGLQIEASVDNETLLSTTSLDEKKHLQLRAFQAPFITREEKEIKLALINSQYTPKEAISDLIHQVANMCFQLRYLRLDTLMKPLYIALLKYLNTKSVPTLDNELKSYCSMLDSKNNISTAYEESINFLVSAELIVQDGNGYAITYFGNEYLAHRVKMKEPI